MKWYKFVLPSSLIVLFFSEFIHPTDELFFDLGEHLLRGQVLFQQLSIPTTNMFSYTYPGYHYVSLEWLTEAMFYIVNSLSGINGLIILLTIISFSSLFILYKFASNRYSLILTSFLSLFYLVGIHERARILPEMFSYLFLAVFTVVLYKFREKNTKLIWLLIPLQLLWVNMHIYFILGVALIGIFLIEALFMFREKYGGIYTRTLIIIFLSTCAVTLINPYGIYGTLSPLTFQQNYGLSVIENGNIFQHNSSTQTGAIDVSMLTSTVMAILFGLAVIVLNKKNRLVDGLIAIVFIPISLIFQRTVGIFFFVSFIPFLYVIHALYDKYANSHKSILSKFFSKSQTTLMYSIPLLAGVLIIWYISGLGMPNLGSSHGNEKAADFFITNKLKGPIFNNYDIGSYLAYRLYPQEKVFVDTRPEAYPASFLERDYSSSFKNMPAFQATENKYKFNTIIYGYRNGMPLHIEFLRYLVQSKDWKVVYLDDTTIIYVKNNMQNKNLIQQYALSDNNFSIPQFQSPDSLYNLVHFLAIIGWKKSEFEVLRKLYEVNPNNCAVLYNLIILVGPHTEAATPYINSFYINKCRR